MVRGKVIFYVCRQDIWKTTKYEYSASVIFHYHYHCKKDHHSWRCKKKKTSKKIEAGKKTMIIPCKEIQDSLRFWILRRGSVQISDTGFQYLSVELGFRIPIVSGIPDSLSCIPDSKAQDFWFHKQNFPGFRNPINGSETNLGLVIKLALNLPGKDKDKLINIWISYIWTASIGTPKVSRIRQTANGRFKLRISQNRKWAGKNSSEQFVWIKIAWNY